MITTLPATPEGIGPHWGLNNSGKKKPVYCPENSGHIERSRRRVCRRFALLEPRLSLVVGRQNLILVW